MHPTEIIDFEGNGPGSLLNMSSRPPYDRLETAHSGNSSINGQDIFAYDTKRTKELRGRTSIAQHAPENNSAGYTHLPSGPSHKARAASMSSSLGSAQNLVSSSSLRDIQVRVASSTKNQRRTQAQALPSHSTGSVRPR